ncbi:MAG TPA: cytochrome c biogenesis heme-transporting ATPase CcmA [Gammaproteobacteria bacterium]|nr:cytochrome c biogenesis heme-transporting ATPase CcmA [Gammaproteobacteria bacterium]
MLQTHDLCCQRGDRLLFEDINFSVSAGALLYIEGHNGSGKTTLLRTLCGLFLPERGTVLWNHTDTRKLGDEFREKLLYLGHHNGIKNDLTAIENLTFSTALNGESASESSIWAALETIGLRGFEDLPTKMLSQGQKRRVALAQLLLSQASLWILDEPFTALDVAAVDMLQGILARHIANGGIVVLTTHQEVALTSGQVQRLKLGR